MHWGLEYHLTESDDPREIAQTLCDLGGNRAFKDYFLCHNNRSVFCISLRNSFFVHNIIKCAANCQ